MTHRFGRRRSHGRVSRSDVWAPAQSDVALVLDGEPRSGDDARGLRASSRWTCATRTPDNATGTACRRACGPTRPRVISPTARSVPRRLSTHAPFNGPTHDWRGAPPRHHQHVVLRDAHRHLHARRHVGRGDRRLPRLAMSASRRSRSCRWPNSRARFGWGYDGVQLFAPTRLYGTPDDARRFVDAAHRLGLAVILDVVYNHFGPVGNFLPEFSTTVLGNPGEWGDSINYDGEGSGPVREFVIENAAYWIARVSLRRVAPRRDERHSRLVARARCLGDLSRRARRRDGTTVFVVGECEPQDARLIKGGPFADGLDALWSEDWHHARSWRSRAGARPTSPTITAPPTNLRRWRDTAPSIRGSGTAGRSRCAAAPPLVCLAPFVAFLENHDQVANTGLGARLYTRSMRRDGAP